MNDELKLRRKEVGKKPADAVAHLNLGVALFPSNKEEALTEVQRALKLGAPFAVVLERLLPVLRMGPQSDEFLCKLIVASSSRLESDDPRESLFLLLAIVKDAGYRQSAESLLPLATLKFQMAPVFNLGLGLIADLLGDLGRPDEGYGLISEIVSQPSTAKLHYVASKLLVGLNRSNEELLSQARAAHELDTSNLIYQENYGYALRTVNQLNAAIEVFTALYQKGVRTESLLVNLSGCLLERGLCSEALKVTQEALDLFPKSRDLFEIYFFLVYPEGSNELRRWRDIHLAGDAYDHCSLETCIASGSSVQLAGDQGVGDQIMHAILGADLILSGAVTGFSVDKRLVNLLNKSFGTSVFIEKSSPQDEPKKERTYKSSDVFLARPPVAQSVPEPNGLRGGHKNPLRIGVSWSSSNNRIGSHKSVSLGWMCEQLKLCIHPDHQIIDLNPYPENEQDTALLQRHFPALQPRHSFDYHTDFDRYAELLSRCDLIVSASNTTVHFAALNQVPTVLLLRPGRGTLWYWRKNFLIQHFYKNVFRVQLDLSYEQGTCSELITFLERFQNSVGSVVPGSPPSP